jgi:hypothetical protein
VDPVDLRRSFVVTSDMALVIRLNLESWILGLGLSLI